MMLELAAFLALAAECARDVAPDTLLAVARHESRLAPWSLNDNNARQSLVFKTREEAETEGARRVAQGHSVDFGLMQINSMNFGWLGVTPSSVLDPCTNITAGASVLKRAWAQAVATMGEGPDALRATLSLYNTGNTRAGIARGYVGQVESVAPVYVVPPLSRIGVPNASPVAKPVTPRTLSPSAPSRLAPELNAFAPPSAESDPFWGRAINPFGSITAGAPSAGRPPQQRRAAQ